MMQRLALDDLTNKYGSIFLFEHMDQPPIAYRYSMPFLFPSMIGLGKLCKTPAACNNSVCVIGEGIGMR
jgi:hypothetical protein